MQNKFADSERDRARQANALERALGTKNDAERKAEELEQAFVSLKAASIDMKLQFERQVGLLEDRVAVSHHRRE